MTITLSQTASWNRQLRNGYRTRYATAAGRFFKVSATSLHSMWDVDEINADGSMYVAPLVADPDPADAADWDFGINTAVFTLAEARALIEKETTK